MIYHPSERCRDAAGLVGFIAVENDPIRLQHRRDEVRGERDAARRDDDGPDVLMRQPPLRLILRAADDEPLLLGERGSVLEVV